MVFGIDMLLGVGKEDGWKVKADQVVVAGEGSLVALSTFWGY